MYKKAQAAMEFLTTYGWAILILLIVIVALASLGIFKGPGIPNYCTSSPPIGCADSKVTTKGTISLTLSAVFTTSATITSFNLDSPIVANCTPILNTIPKIGFAERSCTLNNVVLNKNQKYNGDAFIEYILEGSGSKHSTSINFFGEVEIDNSSLPDNNYVNWTGTPGLIGGFSARKAHSSIDGSAITTNGSDFWVTDETNSDYVYHFDAFGNNITGSPGLIGGFNSRKAHSAIAPYGITTNGSDFWVTDYPTNYVYHFDAFGNNITGADGGFSTAKASSNTTPVGIDTDVRINYILNNGKSTIPNDFWIIDNSGVDYVYHFKRL